MPSGMRVQGKGIKTGEALTQLEDEEVRASREPTHGAASMGRQECKGYKINLQEYGQNANKKASKIMMIRLVIWNRARENCYKGNDEFVPMIGGEIAQYRRVKKSERSFLEAIRSLPCPALWLAFRHAIVHSR